MPKFKGYTITCTCPDSSLQQKFIINSSAFSKSYNRDWTDSDAGAKEGFCKHIWATLIILKLIDKDDLPKDIPIPIFDAEETKTPEIWQPEYGGHSFSYESTFKIPEFKFYKGG